MDLKGGWCGKICHQTWNGADRHRQKILKRPDRSRQNLDVFYCRICAAYHVGKRPPQLRRDDDDYKGTEADAVRGAD